MNRGLIFRIAVGENGFYATLFSLLHIGITTNKAPTFSTLLVLGVWKAEIGLMLAEKYEQKVDMNNHGIS